MSIVKFNNKVLRLNNKTVGWTAPLPPPVLYHVTTNGVNGTVVATPNTGYNGDTITLSNTPDEGYEFDSYLLTGATLYDTNKFDIDNSDVNVVGNFIVAPEPVDPYNPLGLPANTVRVRTSDGNVPIKGNSTSYETATLVEGTTDVYDVYKSGSDFSYMFLSSTNITEVLGANTTNVLYMDSMFSSCTSLTSVPLFDTTNVKTMRSMFSSCTSLTSVPLFDTTNVTTVSYMFSSCTSLTSIPLFDTSKFTNMDNMFYGCTNVQSGALALYQQASSQSTPPTRHSVTFRNCGSNTTQGAAELAQIPSDWK